MNFLKKMFVFLKTSNILVDVKTALLPIIQDDLKELKPKILIYINDKTLSTKEKLIDFILLKVELPWYLKPFKSKVKNVLNKNFDKVLDFILQIAGLK